MLVKGKHTGVDEIMEIEDLRAELSGLRSQYAVGSLADLIETLNDNLEKLVDKPEAPTPVFYDKDLGSAIVTGITKLVAGMRQTIDLSPLIAEIAKQNKAILDLMGRKPEKQDDSRYHELLKLTLAAIAKNNEFMQALLSRPQQAAAAPIVNLSKATEWEFYTEKDKYGNFKTKAKGK
jgi:hypothetical protein